MGVSVAEELDHHDQDTTGTAHRLEHHTGPPAGALLVLLLVLLVCSLEHTTTPKGYALSTVEPSGPRCSCRSSLPAHIKQRRVFLSVLSRIERDEEGREVLTYLDSSAAPPRAFRVLKVPRMLACIGRAGPAVSLLVLLAG